MDGITVDPGARTVRVQAGVRWGQVVAAAEPYGLAPLNGSAPGVGAVSYTLGGGLGILAREFGYAADHVRRLEVVTADGELRHVTPDSDPELYWALLGAGDRSAELYDPETRKRLARVKGTYDPANLFRRNYGVSA